MLERNNIPTGVLIGLILPLIAGFIFEIMLKNYAVKQGLPYLIVVCCNLVLMLYFAKRQQEKTVQGIMLVSFAVMLLVFIFRFHRG
jgi:hypothetical protein